MKERPAVSFAVVEDGSLGAGEGEGAAFPWWSFTKTVIAAAALKLVGDGALPLDEPVQDRPYSLRQLLQHRAGVVNYGGYRPYHEAVARGDEPWPVPLLVARLDAARLRYEPGQGWDYSNVGYLFVRELIERATGTDLGTALSRLVLEPLGIEGARLAQVPADLAGVNLGRIAAYHPGWVYHGLLVGPLPDAALLLDRLMAGALLPPHLLGEMRRPHRLGGTIPGRPWREPGYGLGLMTGATRYGWKAEGHTGGGPGSSCAVYHFPEAQPTRTVAVFAPGDDATHVESAACRRGRRDR